MIKDKPVDQDLLDTEGYAAVDSSEMLDARRKAQEQPRKKRVKGFAAPLGLIVVLLCTLGFFTLVSYTSKFVGYVLDDTSKREAYSSYLAPIVMLDPPNFDNPSHLDASFLLQTSIWSILMDPDRTVAYPTDDSGRTIIPVTDIEVQCTKLYGPGLIIPRESLSVDGTVVEDVSSYDGVVFEYLGDSESYAVPIMGEVGYYKPRVESITKKNDKVYLKTAYLPIESSWLENITGSGNEDAVAKYKIYVLEKNPDTKQTYIVALEDEDVELN